MCRGFFFQIEALLYLKNARLPPIFFLDTNSTCKVLLSPHRFKSRKKYPCISRHHPWETRVSRDAQIVCAVTKVGTVQNTVNSLYCGHPRDHELISLSSQ